MNPNTCRLKVKKSQIFHQLKILQESKKTDGGGGFHLPYALIGLMQAEENWSLILLQ